MSAAEVIDGVCPLDLDRLVEVLTTIDRRSCAEVAHALAAIGIAVVASVPGEKGPLLTKTHTAACDACAAAGLAGAADHGETTDPATIDHLWNVHPDAGVLMKVHPQLLRGDADFATGGELRTARKKLGYGTLEPGPFEAFTPGGTYRRRFFHHVPDGQLLAGGGTKALGVSWYHASGLVMVKGRHPNGIEYRPFLGAEITPVPAALREALGRRYTDNGSAEQAASSADVRKFLAKYTGTSNLAAIGPRQKMIATARTGERHPLATSNLAYGFEEAIAGWYPAQLLHDGIREALNTAKWDGIRLGQEYDDIVAWAVGQCDGLTPEAARINIDKRRAKFATTIDDSRIPPDDDGARDLTIDEIDALAAHQSERVRDTGNDDLAVESWVPVDLSPAFRGELRPIVPEILRRDDGQAIFYGGQVNGAHGDSGSGKSLVALLAATEQMAQGHHVVWIDAEDPNEATIVGRLQSLLTGLRVEDILERFHYISPQTPPTTTAISHLLAQIDHWHPTVVILDSVGELFGLEGISENDDADVGPWFRRVARPIAEAGPAVVLIDHGTKAADNPLYPSGSKRKRAAITGASYLVEAKTPFAKGTNGKIRLTCAKDRHGTYARSEHVATIDVTSYPDGGLSLKVWQPFPSESASGTVPLILAARAAIKAAKAEPAPLSRNGLIEAMTLKARKETKAAGIELAVAHGHLRTVPGPRNASLHEYVSEWVDQADDIS